MRCEPATTIISKLGGTRAVSQVAEVSIHTVIRWRLEREKGGTGGVVPHWHIPKLLAKAKADGIALQPGDFFQFDEVAA